MSAMPYQILAVAAECFEHRLHSAPEADACRAYLGARGYHTADAEAFGLGFADARTIDHLRDEGYTDAQLIDAGLLAEREGRAVPRFRNRLTFPIHDASGQVVGFSARAIADVEPKYLNSPASPTFVKGQLLYNLHRAAKAIGKTGRVIVVEGQFDAVRVAIAGVGEVVAPMGTAMTQANATTIGGLARRVILMYDGDDAGRRATIVAGDLLLATGATVRVVRMPEGQDPDSLVSAIDRAGLDEILEDAPDLLDWRIECFDASGGFRDIARRLESIRALVSTIRAGVGLTRDLYITRAADRLGLKRATIEALLPEQAASAAPSPPRKRRFRAVTSEIIAPPKPDIAPAPARPAPPWQPTPRKAASVSHSHDVGE